MMELALFQVKKAWRYKMQLIMDIFNVILNFCVQYYLWKTVLANNSLYFNNIDGVILYYFFVGLLSVLLRCNASDIADAFKHGKMDRELIRPIKLFEMKMIENVHSNLFLFILTFPLLLCIVIFGCKYIFNSLNLFTVILFLISAGFGYFIYYCIDFLIGLLALLIDEIWAIRGVVTFCINMISGYYLPIGMFPYLVTRVLEYTPFYYIYYFPTIIISESLSWSFIGVRFGIMLLWTLLLYIFSKLIFKKLIKYYTAFGG